MPKTPKLLAAALGLLMVGASITVSAPAQADAGGPTRPWNDPYYYQSYTCAPLVILAFRGSGEKHNSEDYNTINSDQKSRFDPATQLESIAAVNYAESAVRNVTTPLLAKSVLDGTDPTVRSDTTDMVTELSKGIYQISDDEYELYGNYWDKWGDVQRATDTITTNGWEGPRIYGLLQAWASMRFQNIGIGQPLPIIGIGTATNGASTGYAAVDVSLAAIARLGQMTIDSANVGAQAATTYIQQVKTYYASQGCTNSPKFMLIGYSQGAVAARFTAIANPTDVVASFLLGDPFLNSNKASQSGYINFHGGASLTGTGMLANGGTTLVGEPGQPYVLDLNRYNSVTQRATWCHKDDIFCDFQWLSTAANASTSVSAHLNYYSAKPEIGPDLEVDSERVNAGENMAYAIECFQYVNQPTADRSEVGDCDDPAQAASPHNYTDTPEPGSGIKCPSNNYNGYTQMCSADPYAFQPNNAQEQAKAAQATQYKAFVKQLAKVIKAKPKATVSISLPGKKTQFVIPKVKGATYRYDLDGNGKYELKSKRNIATHVYKKAGTTRVHLQVNYGKLGKSVKKYTLTVNTQAIAPSTAALWYDPSHNLDKASLTPIRGAVKLHITGLPKNGEYGLRIVKTAKDPLTVKPTRIYGPYRANAKGEANVKLITKALTRGTYQAVIVSPDGYHRTFTTVKIQ